MRRRRFRKAAAVILSAALVLPSAAQAEAVRAAQVEVLSDGFDTGAEETETEAVSGTVPETGETSAEEIEVFTDEETEETAGASSESGGKNRSMEVFSDGANAVSVAEVQVRIDALPTVDEAAFMNGEMLAEAYEQVQSTYDVYMALTEEQKAEITGAEIFESLFGVFNTMVNTLEVEEQYDDILIPGETYWFDLSQENLPGRICDGSLDYETTVLPDITLTWTPFTYAGTVNAYVLNSSSSGVLNATELASKATDSDSQYGYTYAHSLFISDYNLMRFTSWDTWNNVALVFGRNCEKNGITYKLRLPTMGSAYIGEGDTERGTPQNNEWDTILDKGEYIKNCVDDLASRGQDTTTEHTQQRALRGQSYARMWGHISKLSEAGNMNFRPVLELPSTDELSSDGIKVITINLNGGKVGTTKTAVDDFVNLVVSVDGFTAPSSTGLSRPNDNSGSYFTWLGDDGKLYKSNSSVPSTVNSLTALWELAAPTITEQPKNEEINAGNTVTFSIKASGVPFPTYQWQINKDGINWEDIEDAINSNYVIKVASFDMNDWQYRCVVTNSEGIATSHAATLTVKRPPEQIPEIKINYADETLTGFVNGENYSITIDDNIISIKGDDSFRIDSKWFGKSLSIVRKGDGFITADSEPQSLLIPARPVAPTVGVSYTEETLSTTSDQEWATSGQNVQKWESCSKDMKATAFGWNGTEEVTVRFRTPATESAFVSAEQELTIPTRPATPGDPTVSSRTDLAITVEAVDGQEYRLDDGDWKTAQSESITFENLTAGQRYTIYTRKQATASQFASGTNSVSVTTKASAGEAPSVRTSTVTANSVTLPENQAWEYSADKTSWSGNNTFIGLNASTKYTFYVRVKETDKAMPSEMAAVTVYTAAAKPAEGEGYAVGYTEETLTITDGYEVNTAEAFNGDSIQPNGKIEPGTTYYIRLAEAAGDDSLMIPASEVLAFTLKARPAAPSGLQGVNETYKGDGDGKITGVSSAMEYQKDGAANWTDCTGNEIIGLASGIYFVRIKATDNEFASLPMEVEIKAGVERTYTLNITAPVFDSVREGYGKQDAKALTIASTGNSDTTITSVSLSGEGAEAFTLNKTSGITISAGETDNTTYTIQPNTGLSTGTYTATVIVSYQNQATASAEVSFKVLRRWEPSRPTDGLHPDSNGDLWYYKDGSVDKTFEGMVTYDGSQFYVKDGKVQKIDGLKLVNETWYFLTQGRLQTQHTGLVQYDGEWFYVTKGILDTTISGVIPYDGGEFVFTQGRLIQELNGLWLNPGDHTWYFIANGQVQRSYTGLALYDGHWFHVVNGIFDQTYTGLVIYNNAWFYVTKGELDTTISGVVPYNGGTFIFTAGRLANEANGLWLNPKDKKWYFASNGQIQTQYTGVAMYDNECFYIRKGTLASDYTGTIQYNGATFRVQAGQLYEQTK